MTRAVYSSSRMFATLFTEFRSIPIRLKNTPKIANVNDVVFDHAFLSEMSARELRNFLERRFVVHKFTKRRLLNTEPAQYPLPPSDPLANESVVFSDTLRFISDKFADDMNESLSSLRVITKRMRLTNEQTAQFVLLIHENSNQMSFQQLARASNILGSVSQHVPCSPSLLDVQRSILRRTLLFQNEWSTDFPSLAKLCSSTAKLGVFDDNFLIAVRATLVQSEILLDKVMPDDLCKLSFFNSRFVKPIFAARIESTQGSAIGNVPEKAEAVANLFANRVVANPSGFNVRQVCDLIVGLSRVSSRAGIQVSNLLHIKLQHNLGSLRYHGVSCGGACNSLAAYLWVCTKEKENPQLELVSWMLTGIRDELQREGESHRGLGKDALRKVMLDCRNKLVFLGRYIDGDPLLDQCLSLCSNIIEEETDKDSDNDL